MTGLILSPGLKPAPIDVVTSTFAILAVRGAGKTYTASVLAEEIVTAGQRVCVFDPVGVWWGMRSAADGVGPGLPVVIIGGEHGDVELDEHSGAAIADLVIAGDFSCVLDVSLLETKASQIRFMLAFARRLYHANRRPLHLILDEADMLAPQRPMGEDAALLGAIENVVRRGRARGLGCTFVTQRAAVLNKNVLTQVETLIIMRTTSPQDREAISAWIEAQASADERDAVIDSLPSLKTGEAWVWSPSVLETLVRVKIRARRTFDSSATPKVGEQRIEPKALAPVDIEAIRKALAPVKPSPVRDVGDEEAKERLVAFVADLNAQIGSLTTELETLRATSAAREAALDAAQKALLAAAPHTEEALRALARATDPETRHELHVAPPAVPSQPFGSEPWARDHILTCNDAPCMACGRARNVLGIRTPTEDLKPQPRPSSRATSTAEIGAGARRMLVALATFAPKPLSRPQLATLAQFAPNGGGFRNVLSELVRHAPPLIEKDGDLIRITAAGSRAAGPVSRPTTTADLVAVWNAKLGAGARRMLAVLIGRYPATATRQVLANEAGLDVDGGGFRNCLSELSTNGLIEKRGRDIRASEAFFMAGRR